ncbi:EpsG family protein [Cetobacterium somerae]|uniref:EpsG family protein n=1 Tax=Cetobacterium somerae TaxID=188913 RepID=UPI002E7C120A|nr:EpsG family protein [Cetobacterium somerae]WVJ00704.1 EpsG family protein [Cetobacterium somerae]
MGYIILYILLIGIFIIYNLSKKNKNIFIYISILLLIIFSAIRFDVGFDYKMYYIMVLNNGNHFNIDVLYELNRVEPLIRKIMELLKNLGFPQLFFILTSIVINYLICITLSKYSKNYFISMFYYIAFPTFYLQSLGFVRQWMAMSIVFYSYKYLEKKSKYFFLNLIAIGFHSSAILGILIYIFSKLNLKRKNRFYLVIITVMVSEMLRNFIFMFARMNAQYKIYIDKIIGEQGNKTIVLMLIICFISIILEDRISISSRKAYNISYFSIIFLILLNGYGHMSLRVGNYFFMFTIIYIGELFLNQRKLKKSIIEIIFVIGCFMLLVGSLYFTKNPDKDPFLPYKTYFGKTLKDFK